MERRVIFEDACWVKHPSKRPTWLKKKKNKDGNSNSNYEEIGAGVITEYSFMMMSEDDEEPVEEFDNDRFVF